MLNEFFEFFWIHSDGERRIEVKSQVEGFSCFVAESDEGGGRRLGREGGGRGK